MGFWNSPGRPLTIAGTLEFEEVSAKTFLAVFCNIQAYPKMFPEVHEITWVRGGGDEPGTATKGASWVEDRTYNGRPLKIQVSMTELLLKKNHLDAKAEISVAATSVVLRQPWITPKVMNTFSFTIVNDENKERNRILVRYSAAFVPMGWYARLFAKLFFRKRFQEDFDQHVRQEFAVIYREALLHTVREARGDEDSNCVENETPRAKTQL